MNQVYDTEKYIFYI